jgi:hypothetical protein
MGELTLDLPPLTEDLTHAASGLDRFGVRESPTPRARPR